MAKMSLEGAPSHDKDDCQEIEPQDVEKIKGARGGYRRRHTTATGSVKRSYEQVVQDREFEAGDQGGRAENKPRREVKRSVQSHEKEKKAGISQTRASHEGEKK